MHPGASRMHRLYTGVSDARPAYLRVSFRKRSGRSVVMKSTRFSMAHIMSAGLFTVQTIEPILNPILVAVFYGETIGATAVIGALLVVGSATVYNVRQAKNAA